ncbi:MAG: hypothetical protein OER56_11110 [Hyphomicrobiales bacterium]|nr:hypothetical protein [Hyphomicrobiales bacterium]
MSFADCLQTARDAGELSASEERRLLGLYNAMQKQNAKDGATAPLAARQALAELLEAEKGHKRMQLALTVRNMAEIQDDIGKFARDRHKPDIAEAGLAMLDHNGRAPFFSAEGRRKAIIGQAHGRMEQLLFEFRKSAVLGDNLNVGSRRLSFRHGQARLDNVVREAFGTGTGDEAAKGLAKSWFETSEWLRRRFNAAGGAIAKLENWGLPQQHNALALRKVGRQAWKQEIVPLLDPGRMRDPLTGRALTPQDLDEALDHVFESITTDGWNTREPQRRPFGRGALGNQHAEHRFLVFKSPDDWLTYQRNFGEGDPFSAMMRHINVMARDIAHMERFGPNPNATIEWMKQSIQKEAAKASNGQPSKFNVKKAANADSKSRSKINKIETIWADMNGSLNTPVNVRSANVMGGLRNIITSSILGQAFLSAIGDTGLSLMARQFNGLPMTSTVNDIVKQFRRANRRDAVAAGLILDAAEHTFTQQARYAGSLAGPQWTSYLTDRVLTWTALTPWTQSARHAFGMSFQRASADMRALQFAELPPMFADMFRRWGLDADDWNQLRAIEPHDAGSGATFLRPQEVAKIDQKLADRYLEMILQETEFAVPSSTPRSRALITGKGRPGTFWGEVQNSFLMFKSFGAAFGVLNTHRVLDAVFDNGGKMRAAGGKYAGGVLLSMTLLGGLSLQLKQLASGRDPRDVYTGEAKDSLQFLGAAALQGGGLGLYGDFLFADVNRYGGGFAASLSGPAIEHLWDAWTLTGGNAIEMANGKNWEESGAGREFVKFLGGNTPGGNMWWAKLGYERMVLDQLQYLIDPRANASFKRKQKFWEREFGQEYFWRPGQLAPDRAPQIF